MSASFKEMIQAHLAAPKFTPFLKGVDVKLPDGRTERLLIQNLREIKIPRAFSFTRYTYAADISGGGFTERGFAEADTRLLALQKCIAEAVERIIFRLLQSTPFGTPNSNGWAAHTSERKSRNSAMVELLERDAALIHWLYKIPLFEVPSFEWPAALQDWSRTDLCQNPYPNLRLLLSFEGYVPLVSTVLLDNSNYGVISHSTAKSLERAISKSLAEATRLSRIACSRIYFDSSKNLSDSATSAIPPHPADHAVYYAHHHSFPGWVFGKALSLSAAQSLWRKAVRKFNPAPLDVQFLTIPAGPLYVSSARSTQVQALYFGSTREAEQHFLINSHRVMNSPLSKELNYEPHFVA